MRRIFSPIRRYFATETSKSGSIDQLLQKIRSSKAVVVGNGGNSEVNKAVEILGKHAQNACEVIDLNKIAPNRNVVEQKLHRFTCRKGSPLIFVKGNCVGGIADLEKLNSNGVLAESLNDHEFDLVVIGGGSGGLAAAQEAANHGKKIACLDFVPPTPSGTTWGLGGTCVNVGCIPKKLMHQAALLGHGFKDARAYGWKFDEKVTHDWTTMTNGVQEHIRSLNWNSRVNLNEKKTIKYFNAYGRFVGSHTVMAKDKKGKEVKITGDRFLIATGLRPNYLNVPGAKEFCITSDDLFNLPYPPGKTLVVGASYVSLECAGFLHGVGFDTTVMVRSILLRGFDQEMAERIGKHMVESGIRFVHETIPTKIEKIEDGKPGRLRVTAKSNSGEEIVDEYNTVVLAIGRRAMTDNMGLDAAGVKLNEKNRKVVCSKNEQSVTAPHVYAVGDVLDGGIELTPVAIQAGRLLARRLFGDGIELCDYTNIPTTVFTPLEYGCCGLTEEDAIKQFGADAIEVFHIQFDPLEYTVPHRMELEHCYAKLLCNKKDDLRVVGFHYFGPNAGEVTQGYAIGMKMGATKSDFDKLIGIHPTTAEIFTTLQVTKASQKPYKQGAC